MTFEFTHNDNNRLTHERIFAESILVDYSLANLPLHVLRAHDEHIFTVFYKDPVWLHKVFVIEEQIMTITMSYRATHALVLKIFDFDHCIKS